MLQRLGDRLDPQLVAVRSDEADLPGADAVVDAVLLALSRCGAAMAAHSCAMGDVSLFGGCRLLDAKPAEHTGRRPSRRSDAATSSRWTWTHASPARSVVAGWGLPPLRLNCRQLG